MITIISPAKGFKKLDKIENRIIENLSLPIFHKKSYEILSELKKLNVDEICGLLKINNEIGIRNYNRYKNFKFDKKGLPALLAYDGMQYSSIKTESLNQEDMQFSNDSIRILSGLYGILKPLDSIYPYRLEMSTKLSIANTKNLYKYWNNSIYKQLKSDLQSYSGNVILNLASDEYSKIIKKYLDDDLVFVTCTFKVNKNGKLTTHSTISKPARGKMVNYIIKNRADDIETIKKFNYDGFSFHSEIVSKNGKIIELIFVKNEYD